LASSPRIHPVILAGGSGTRLWPLSRPERPKQFLSLTGERSLFELAVMRTQNTDGFAPPLVVTNESQRFLLAEQLRSAGAVDARILLEPEGRNTAPAIALAALLLCEDHTDPSMLVMPADHAITDMAAFHRAVETAATAASGDSLVTFGIRPAYPETGYGYIEAGEPLADGAGARRVRRFVEKPDRPTAERYLAAGNFLWNSGIFFFRARALIAALERFAPDILAACRAAIERRTDSPDFLRPDGAAFAAAPKNSIDYAVMEKAEDIAVVPADFGWSDIGSWSAVWDVVQRDGMGNAALGEVLAEDCRGCLFHTDGPAIAAVGVADLVVVSTADAVLVIPRARAQEVKRIVERLEAEGRAGHTSSPRR